MKHRLLVVDDAMIIREMIKDVAIPAGWEIVAEASNGQEAIDAYRQTSPDAVTLDLVMPQFDGLYALEGIVAFDPRASILVVSALDQRTVLEQAVTLGAKDFIVKPFNNQCLQNALSKLQRASLVSS